MNHKQEVKVWDPFVRLFHWSLVVAFTVAFVTEDEYLGVHSWAGYIVLTLVLLRLIWGVIGTRYARFTDFVRAPNEILRYLGTILRGHPRRYLGHNPAGGAMVVMLLVMLLFTTMSGLLLYGIAEYAGPLAPYLTAVPRAWGEILEDIHEVLANTTLLLVLLHVAGVVLAGRQHRENLVRAMINGRKAAEEDREASPI